MKSMSSRPAGRILIGTDYVAAPPGTEAPPAVRHPVLPPKYAHKGPGLDNTARTQGRDQALVCDDVLRNLIRCVRNRGRWPGGKPSSSSSATTPPLRLPGPLNNASCALAATRTESRVGALWPCESR